MEEGTIDTSSRWLWAAVTLTTALGILLVRPFLLPPDRVMSVPYATFKSEAETGNILAVTFDERDIRGTFRAPVEVRDGPDARSALEFSTRLPEGGDPELRDLIWSTGAQITGQPGRSGSSAGWPALPILASLGLILLIILLLEGRRRETGA